MAEKMTLAEVPGALRGLAKVIREHGTCAAMAIEHVADAVDAHLAGATESDAQLTVMIEHLTPIIEAKAAQPAQAVDVGAIREVAKDIHRCAGNNNAAFHHSWADKLTAALQERGNG